MSWCVSITWASIASATLRDAECVIGAGRLAIAQRNRLLAAHQSFAIETTLTDKSERDLMRKASSAGCKVNLIYIGLGDVGYSIGRVRSQVASGGHTHARAISRRNAVSSIDETWPIRLAGNAPILQTFDTIVW